MKTRRQVSAQHRAWLNLILILLSVAMSRGSGVAQEIPLIGYDAEWRFFDGATNAPPHWNQVEFDDSSWSLGQGGFATDYYRSILETVPVGTGISQALYYGNPSIYFRTRFQFTNAIERVQLLLTNLLDDGAVFYLNGAEFARFGMPDGPIVHTNLPTRSGAVDAHGADVFVYSPTNLLSGGNLLAVELHSIPGHRVFASTVKAWLPTPIQLRRQPQSLAKTNGESASFEVVADGFPLFYQWQKNGTDIPGANSPVLAFPRVVPSDEAQYRIVITNSLMSVTSSVANLLVIVDRAGPKALLAVADNGFGPASINIQFSERLNSASALNREHYRVSRLGTSSFVPVTSVLYNVTLGALLRLDASDTNWVQFDDYVVTINGVTDPRGNVIAPNTRVPVAWRFPTNLITGSQSWDFHDSAIFDPGVYDEPWYAEDYVPGPWWGQGSGGFFGGPTAQYPCPLIATPQVAMSYQPEPTLFRTSFQWPAHWPNTGSLSLRFGVDDALVVYVNGTEYYRYNAAGPAGSAVTSQSRALSRLPNAFCITNIVLNTTNLHSGTNWIAVAAIQWDFDQQDSYFVFDVSGSVFLAPELPNEPLPALQGSVAGPDELLFSWTGSGYALETSESLELGPLSYPEGPWIEVPQMSNPYVWNLTNGPQRYFRLKR